MGYSHTWGGGVDMVTYEMGVLPLTHYMKEELPNIFIIYGIHMTLTAANAHATYVPYYIVSSTWDLPKNISPNPPSPYL